MRFSFSLILLLLFFLVIPLLAQATGEAFDWSALGVDVVVVGIIITAIQVLKKFLSIPSWIYVLLAMFLAAIYAVVTHLTAGVDVILKLAFSYATAAAFLYDAGKTLISKKTTP